MELKGLKKKAGKLFIEKYYDGKEKVVLLMINSK